MRRVGWIGAGVMGRSMCGHLLAAGYPVVVHTRTRSSADGLVAAGAGWAESPRAVAAMSDVVFSMVGLPADVEAVLLGEDGAVTHARAGQIFVDMTTSRPELAVRVAHVAMQHNAHALDAPVSGGDIGAREARLSIMVGGDAETFAAVQPLLAKLGKTVVHQGPAGAGQHTKMVNQVLIATTMIGLCEALLYGWRAGLDLSRVLESVSGGAAGSWSLTNYAPRILRGDFAPGFFVEHFLKDLRIALDEAKRMRLVLPGLALAEQLYIAVEAEGSGKLGTQSLVRALAKMSSLTWPTI